MECYYDWNGKFILDFDSNWKENGSLAIICVQITIRHKDKRLLESHEKTQKTIRLARHLRNILDWHPFQRDVNF